MKMGTSALQTVKKTTSIDVIYTFDKCGTLAKDLIHEQYGDENFRLAFLPEEGLGVSDLIKILDIYLQKRMQESYWRFIGASVFAACTIVHKVSRAIAKQKALHQ